MVACILILKNTTNKYGDYRVKINFWCQCRDCNQTTARNAQNWSNCLIKKSCVWTVVICNEKQWKAIESNRKQCKAMKSIPSSQYAASSKIKTSPPVPCKFTQRIKTQYKFVEKCIQTNKNLVWDFERNSLWLCQSGRAENSVKNIS